VQNRGCAVLKLRKRKNSSAEHCNITVCYVNAFRGQEFINNTSRRRRWHEKQQVDRPPKKWGRGASLVGKKQHSCTAKQTRKAPERRYVTYQKKKPPTDPYKYEEGSGETANTKKKVQI